MMYVEIYSERLNEFTRGKTSWGIGFEQSIKMEISDEKLKIRFAYNDDSMGDGSRGGDDRTMYRKIKVDLDSKDLRRIIDFAVGNQFLEYAESETTKSLRTVLQDLLKSNAELKQENVALKQKIEAAINSLSADT